MSPLDDHSRFSGIERLYGQAPLKRLAEAHMAVIGIGGVGSWAAEALARSGIGRITIVDFDHVCISNVNRQLHALDDNIDKPKTEVMAKRIRGINPACEVNTWIEVFNESTADVILDSSLDIVIDAIDDIPNKCRLIHECRQRTLPMVVSGGAGGRIDPTKVTVADLNKSYGDALLRKVRQSLKREYHFSAKPKTNWKIPAVFSSEPIHNPEQKTYGTASFVTGTFGFTCAAKAIDLYLSKATAIV